MVNLYNAIKHYRTINEQEERDKAVMLDFMSKNPDCLLIEKNR